MTKIQSIADKAGVSRMTVSRVLNNKPWVKAAVREKVLAVAKELGYRPNPLVSTWMSHVRAQRPTAQGQVIAFVTAFDSPDKWREMSIILDYYSAAKERAFQMGYSLEQFWVNDTQMPGEKVSKILNARGITGVLIAPLPPHLFRLNLAWEKLASASIGETLREPLLHHACNDTYRTMRYLVQNLQRLGYTRIGLFLTKECDQRVGGTWRAGYLTQQDITYEPQNRLPIGWAPELWGQEMPESRKVFIKWLEENRPDVVVSIHDRPLQWLREMGLQVPKDIGFAKLHVWPHEQGRVAGMLQNSNIIAWNAIDLIIGQHHRNEVGIPIEAKCVAIQGRWAEGASVTLQKSARVSRRKKKTPE